MKSGTSPIATPTPVDEEDTYPPLPYAWYVVGVLTLAYVFRSLIARSSTCLSARSSVI